MTRSQVELRAERLSRSCIRLMWRPQPRGVAYTIEKLIPKEGWRLYEFFDDPAELQKQPDGSFYCDNDIYAQRECTYRLLVHVDEIDDEHALVSDAVTVAAAKPSKRKS